MTTPLGCARVPEVGVPEAAWLPRGTAGTALGMALGGTQYAGSMSQPVPSRREQAAVLALARRTPKGWHLLAQAVERAGTALPLAAGEWPDDAPREILGVATATLDSSLAAEAELDELEEMISTLATAGISLVTILDGAYPSNLRLVYDRPPFLFVRGDLQADDSMSIAVVGTRKASVAGLDQAARIARGLAERGVTVISGLALGIDGAAHRATLEAKGRTIAVVGHGLKTPIYPKQHAGLAEAIVEAGGAVVSQFLPDTPPRPERFPMRNRTMSGLALGTVVIEASNTSGARMQARVALEHGKRVFLVRGLVTREPWARAYSDHPGVTVVDDAVEVLEVIHQLPDGYELTLS